jgi:hypothetical protein
LMLALVTASNADSTFSVLKEGWRSACCGCTDHGHLAEVVGKIVVSVR